MASSTSSTPFVVEQLPRILIAMACVAGLLGIAVCMLYFVQFSGPLEASGERWGQFGDYVGGVLNPVFAYMAFIALMLTIYVQLYELRTSTKELRASAEALRTQNKASALQSFEGSFFQMVKLHSDIVSAIDIHTKSKKSQAFRVTRGRDCFKIFFGRFERQAEEALRGDYYPLDYRGAIAKAYQQFHERNEPNVGHYFRNLYRVFKFISESDVENKRRYSGIVRAQLSTYELILLFYNGLSAVGGNFSRYIIEFELFENLAFEHLLYLSEDIELYDLRAFGDQASAIAEAAEATGGLPRVLRT